MSQDGANQSQDVQESDDHTTIMPLSLENTVNSNSSSSSIKSREANVVLEAKPASPEIGGKGKDSVVVDRVEEAEGEGDGDRVEDAEAEGEGDGSQSKSKSSSDGSDHELEDAVACSWEEGGASRNSNGKRATEVEHQIHIWTERERRKKMKNMFSSLHAMLPDLPEKTDKASIVGEAINYITSLQRTLAKLERVKLERMRAQQNGGVASASVPAIGPATRQAALADMVHAWNMSPAAAAGGAGSSAAAAASRQFETWSGQNVVLNMAGDDAVITLCTRRQRGIFTTVVGVLEKHGVDVVTATVSADQNRNIFNLHARMNGAPNQVPVSVTVEDKWKLAVSELMVWLSN